MTHLGVWAAIDALAANCGKSRSGMAKACGMDATTFNPSKRFDKYGKPRWPSSQTMSKVIKFANVTGEEFGKLASQE